MKLRGMSLQSMIVAGVLGAILAGVAISSLWGAVGKSKVTAERATLDAIGEAVDLTINQNEGSLFTVTDETVNNMKSSLKALPNHFDYNITSYGTGKTIGIWIDAAATADQASRDRFDTIIEDLDVKIDGENNATGGNFRYDTATKTYSFFQAGDRNVTTDKSTKPL